MMYSIHTQDFKSAALYGVEFSRTSITAQPLPSTKSLYSLSKLCAYADADHDEDADLADVKDTADRVLLEVLAQERLISVNGGQIPGENPLKMSTDHLIDELSLYLRRSMQSVCLLPSSITKSEVTQANIHMVNTFIAVMTEQMKSNSDISPQEDINIKITHNLLDLWSYIVMADFLIIYDVYKHQNLPSEMIQSKLYGDESSGSLLIKILTANMGDAKKNIIDPRVMLGYNEFQVNIVESTAIDDFLNSAPNDTITDKIIQYLVEAAYKMINDIATTSKDSEITKMRDACFSMPPQFYVKKIDQCINLVLLPEAAE